MRSGGGSAVEVHNLEIACSIHASATTRERQRPVTRVTGPNEAWDYILLRSGLTQYTCRPFFEYRALTRCGCDTPL